MVINCWTSLGLILLTGNIENSSQTLSLRKKGENRSVLFGKHSKESLLNQWWLLGTKRGK